jgi:hypothetical protein
MANKQTRTRIDGRCVITVKEEVYNIIDAGKHLANTLNDEASVAIPQFKTGKWSLGDVIQLAVTEWIISTKKAHNRALSKLEKKMQMKFDHSRQPSQGAEVAGHKPKSERGKPYPKPQGRYRGK